MPTIHESELARHHLDDHGDLIETWPTITTTQPTGGLL